VAEKTKSVTRPASGKTRDFQALSRSVGHLTVKARLLERLLHLFTDVSHPRKNLEAVLDASMEAIPCEAASVLLGDPARGDCFFAAARGPVAEKVLKIRLARGQGIVGAAMEEKRVFAVSDVTREPKFAREVSKSLGFATRSLLAVPMIHKGEALGTIELINKKGDDVWTKQEIELLERSARAAASLLMLGQ
jgi:GAF domain-containing protein